MIRHTVTFTFKPALDEQSIASFFTAAKQLANISGVQNFECLKQVSTKNNFQYGLSMEFETPDLYSYYNNHPDHVSFVQQHWVPNVQDFLEIDYEPL
jgi:hypothetical protein